MHEIEHPLSNLISGLNIQLRRCWLESKAVVGTSDFQTHVKNGQFSVVTWTEAVGHLAEMASTHPDAGKKTMEALGVIADMAGKLSHLSETMRVLSSDISHMNKNDRESLTGGQTTLESKETTVH